MSPIYYYIISILVIIAAIATIRIGISRENKEGNPGYDRNPLKNMAKITFFYVFTGLLGLGSLIYALLFVI